MWNAEDFVDFFFINKILYIDYNSLVSTLNLVLWKANQHPDAQQTPLRPLVQLEILGYCMLFFSCVISVANEVMTGKKNMLWSYFIQKYQKRNDRISHKDATMHVHFCWRRVTPQPILTIAIT